MSEAAVSGASPPQPTLVKGLSLLDTVLLLVGGVIGSGIFLTAGQVATELRQPWLFILVWMAGGAISLLACFAVAELGGMFPQAGGQYVFLREAFGELPAFLYGWMIFAVVQTGTIAALAVGFAQYFGAVFPTAASTAPLWTLQIGALHWSPTPQNLVAVISIAVLTFVNVVGLRRGSLIVNLATWLKFAAIGALVILGLSIGHGDWSHFRSSNSATVQQSSQATPQQTAAEPSSASQVVGQEQLKTQTPDLGRLTSAFGVALIAVFFAFDGWVYITWVAGEVKDAARNIPRALIIGLLTVAAIYVAINLVYVYALPMRRIIEENAVVKAAGETLFSPRWGRWLGLMVAISCFGAMSSAILCTARIFYAMAQDGIFFQRMANVHPRWRTPAFSLVAQGIWSAVLALIGLYDQLLTYSIFMMIVGYLATVSSLFVVRRKYPDLPRPYRCTGYPWVPLLYLLIAFAWTVNTIWARPLESLAGLFIVLAGVPGYVYWTRRRNAMPQPVAG